MASLANYFIEKKENAISSKDCIVLGKKYRFTILTDRLVRLEYSKDGVFEDRPTARVIYRNFERPVFTVEESDTLIQIDTKYFTLNYVKNKPFKGGRLTPASNLKVVLKNSDRQWYYKHPEARNFGGINYSLDNFEGALKLDKGMYSTDGFCVIDDSNSYVLGENDEFIERENKEIDLYLFMYRRDFSLCLKDYYTLTGYPKMIPRYALGNWWYKNERYTNNDIVSVINNFYENNIPIKGIILGDKWHDNITPYIFDNKVLNQGELLNYLNSRNIKLALSVDPSLEIAKNSNYYSNIGPYLNGKSNFIPFSNNAIALYFNMFIRPLENSGISFFNIDYNNIKDRLTLWKIDHYHTTEREINGIRGLILSRNSKIAPHRYPIVYTGKTKVSWNTLNVLPRYNLSASNDGLSWVAHAIGGFYKGIEQDELYLRYIQFATFSPIFILASDAGEYYKREPWKWSNDLLNVVKNYMQLRDRLIPYIYNAGYLYHKTGAPLVQPFYYKYPKIYDEPYYKNQYFFGNDMFVAPITKKKNVVINRVVQRIFVPEDIWFDFKSGLKYPGNKYYMNFYKDDDYPVFCRAGSIIPLGDFNDIPKTLELIVFPLKNNTYTLYEDDGITNRYKNGEYMISSFEYIYEKDNYTLKISKLEGVNIIDNRNYKVRFKNVKNISSVNILINNKPSEGKCYYDKNDLIIEVNDVIVSSSVVINIKGTDIEISSSYLINNDIKGILNDLEIQTVLKEKIANILFSNLSIRKKRIAIRKLKRQKLEPKFVKMFINLLEYISNV